MKRKKCTSFCTPYILNFITHICDSEPSLGNILLGRFRLRIRKKKCLKIVVSCCSVCSLNLLTTNYDYDVEEAQLATIDTQIGFVDLIRLKYQTQRREKMIFDDVL